MSIHVGDIVPYINTRKNIKSALVTSIKEVSKGKFWFYGINTKTGALVWYPVHKSLELAKELLLNQQEEQK